MTDVTIEKKDYLVAYCVAQWNIEQLKGMPPDLPNTATPSATSACTIGALCKRGGEGAIPTLMTRLHYPSKEVMDDPTQVYRVMDRLEKHRLVRVVKKGQYAHTKAGESLYRHLTGKPLTSWPDKIIIRNGSVIA